MFKLVKAKSVKEYFKMPHKIPTDLRNAIVSAPMVKAVWEDITPLARNERYSKDGPC